MIWKKIDGFENYSVSDSGLVRNDVTGKIIKSHTGSTGYKTVHLYKNRTMKNVKLHRIVAQAFVPNPKHEKCVNHINGDKCDNRIENLEWCSHSQNNIHSYRFLGRSSCNAIKAMTDAKMKPVVCLETNKTYTSIKEAEKETGIHHTNISSCAKGKRATAGGFHWGYAV